MIRNPVKLGFDPAKLGGNIKLVFDDPVARTFWLAWRQGHIVSDKFDEYVLQIAARIKVNKPKTPEELASCVGRMWHSDFMREDVDRFCQEAIVYFNGDQSLDYTIAVPAK